ncbi:Uncharacterised protein [Vibrio cholerae]|nr:Uncharacterised protein [Vibrio cholerae]
MVKRPSHKAIISIIRYRNSRSHRIGHALIVRFLSSYSTCSCIQYLPVAIGVTLWSD